MFNRYIHNLKLGTSNIAGYAVIVTHKENETVFSSTVRDTLRQAKNSAENYRPDKGLAVTIEVQRQGIVSTLMSLGIQKPYRVRKDDDGDYSLQIGNLTINSHGTSLKHDGYVEADELVEYFKIVNVAPILARIVNVEYRGTDGSQVT